MLSRNFGWTTGGGGAIHALEWEPEGRATAVIVLVHGLGEHSGRYAHLASWFTARGVAVLAFDLPGHGASAGPRGHASYGLVEELIEGLLGEARARHPGLPLFLYGHSLGGAIVANHLIDRRPAIAGAIVTSPGLSPAKPVPAAKLLLAKILARLAPSFTLPNDLELEGISRDPEVVRRYREDPLVHDRVSARLGLDLLTRGESAIARAKEIAAPVLLLQGGADRLVDPRATARLAAAAGPNVAYRVFEGHYHELHNEPDRETLFALVLEWMEGVAARP